MFFSAGKLNLCETEKAMVVWQGEGGMTWNGGSGDYKIQKTTIKNENPLCIFLFIQQ